MLNKRINNLPLISILASFFTSLLLLLLGIIIILNFTLFNFRFMNFIFEKENFFENSYNELCEKLENISVSTAIPTEVLKSAISPEAVKDDILAVTKGSYYSDYQFDKTIIYDKCYTTLIDYAKSLNTKIDEQLENNFSYLSTTISEKYESSVKFPFIKYIGKMSQSIRTTFLLTLIIVLVLLGFLFYSQITLLKNKRELSWFLINTFTSTGFMFSVFPFSILLYDKLKFLQINIRSLYTVTIGYIHSLLYITIFFSFIFFIVSLLVFIFVYMPYKNKQKIN